MTFSFRFVFLLPGESLSTSNTYQW